MLIFFQHQSNLTFFDCYLTQFYFDLLKTCAKLIFKKQMEAIPRHRHWFSLHNKFLGFVNDLISQ